MALNVRGMHYDVGQQYAVGSGRPAAGTRPYFDESAVAADMAMIAGQLHANAVRVTGTDLSRLEVASRKALDAGMRVWFSPHPGDLAGDEIVSYLAEAARVAETLRSDPGSVTMVAGCELSLFGAGFLPGATLADRLDRLMGSADPAPDVAASFSALPRTLNCVLGDSVAAIRDNFGGPITYASAPWEAVDWEPFDLVAVDLYRDSSNAAEYRDQLRSYARFGKPVVVSEFGCCTYRGAADAGGAGFMVVDDSEPETPAIAVAGIKRSEAEQSRYAEELLAVFGEEGIHGSFWHTFAGWAYPHRSDPRTDLDLASFGVVKVIEAPGNEESPNLEPKEVFRVLAEAYAS